MGHLWEPAPCTICRRPTKFECDCPCHETYCTPCWLRHVDSNTPDEEEVSR